MHPSRRALRQAAQVGPPGPGRSDAKPARTHPHPSKETPKDRIENSIALTNPHGRVVRVDAARKEYLLARGFTLATEAKTATAAETDDETETEGTDEAADLAKMTKKELVAFALDVFGLELDENLKKDEMIEAILGAE
ncbi:MAG: hypothetical protein ACF8MF_06850 [Phycisphaerales bacterium JB052]